jgi:DNA-binding protein H-NS
MSTLQTLLAQRAALEEQIQSTQKRERHDAISKIKILMQEYGVSLADLGGKSNGKSTGGKGSKVATKFHNKATGENWTGRGLQPKWLKAAIASGKKLSDFSV